MRVAASVLAEVGCRAPILDRTGGSLPSTAHFQEVLGAPTIHIGMILPDQAAHAPNEFQRLDVLRRHQIAYAMFLERLAEAR